MNKKLANVISQIDSLRALLDGKEPGTVAIEALTTLGRQAYKHSKSREDDDLICDALVGLLDNQTINDLSTPF